MLFKVYDQCLYFTQNSFKTVKIWSVEQSKTVFHFIRNFDIFNPQFQLQESPLLISNHENGNRYIYNVFHKQPLLSLTNIQIKSEEDFQGVSAGINISAETLFEIYGNETQTYIQGFLDNGMTICDFLAEYGVLVLTKRTDDFSFSVLIQINAQWHYTLTESCGTYLFRTTNYSSTDGIEYFYLFTKELKNLKCIRIPLDKQQLDIDQSAIFNVYASLEEYIDQALYCSSRNEMIVSTFADSTQTTLKNLYAFVLDHNNLEIVRKVLLIPLSPVKLFCYDNRKLFFERVIGKQSQSLVAEIGDSFKVSKLVTLKNVDQILNIIPVKNYYIAQVSILKFECFHIFEKQTLDIKAFITFQKNYGVLKDRSYPSNIYLYPTGQINDPFLDKRKSFSRLSQGSKQSSKKFPSKSEAFLFQQTNSNSLQDDVYLLKMNIFEGHPVSIPEGLLIQDDPLVTRYDQITQTLSFHENPDKWQDHQMLAKLKLRTSFNSITDFYQYESPDNIVLEGHFEQEINEYVKRAPLDVALSYCLINRYYFLFECLKHKDITDVLISKLDMTPHLELPYLFPKSGASCMKKSPFEQAIHSKLTHIVQRFIHYMVVTDIKGLLYQTLMDQNLEQLLIRGIDLKPYFLSKIAFHKIESPSYPTYHNVENSSLLPVNKERFSEILNDYNGIFGDKVKHSKKKLFEMMCQRVCWCCYRDRTKEQPDKISGASGSQNIKSFFRMDSEQRQAMIEKLQEYQIEYQTTTFKQTLTRNRHSFMQALQYACNRDVSYLDIPSLQAVIRYKWSTYTKRYYIKSQVFHEFFMLHFFIDLYLSSVYGTDIYREKTKELMTSIEDGNVQLNRFIGVRVIGLILILYVSWTQLIQIWYRGFKKVTSSTWFFTDFALIIAYIGYINASFNHATAYNIKALQALVLFFSFIRINQLMRIYDTLSFLVHMVTQVTNDIRPFMFYYFIFICTFAIFLSIVLELKDDYENAGAMGYFSLALRTAIGDFDFSTLLHSSGEYTALFAIGWLLVMIRGYVIFMNFIIAVVNESYENCMTKMVAQTYKNKLDMIVDREAVMTQKQLASQQYFPQYIILRQSIESDGAASDTPEWQGFIKEISTNAEKANQKQAEEFQRYIQNLTKQSAEQIRSEFKQEIFELKEQLQRMHEDQERQMNLLFDMINGKKEKISPKPILKVTKPADKKASQHSTDLSESQDLDLDTSIPMNVQIFSHSHPLQLVQSITGEATLNNCYCEGCFHIFTDQKIKGNFAWGCSDCGYYLCQRCLKQKIALFNKPQDLNESVKIDISVSRSGIALDSPQERKAKKDSSYLGQDQ